jgi:hypothetical protein
MPVEVRRIELAVAIALLILGVLVAATAARMPMGSPSLPGPGFLPLILGILIAVVAAIVGVRSLTTPGQAEPVLLGHANIAITAVALIGVSLLFERLGYFPSVIAFMFVMLVTISPLNWRRSAVAAIVVAVACHLFFDVLLGVRLPPMPFWF